MELTLYQVEDDLAAMLNTEEVVSPDRLEEFGRELAAHTEAALTKRDNCIRFMVHVEDQIQFTRDEEKRLAERRRRLEGGLERFKAYVTNVIQQFAPDMRKGPRRLEGRVGELAAVRNPDSVNVIDAQQLPPEFIQIQLRLPGLALEGLPEGVAEALKRQAVEYAVVPVKASIAAALKAGRHVPGARMQDGDMRLRIR